MNNDSNHDGGCCPGCCRAPDLGVHDYCLPCATNPACCTSTKAFQTPVSQADPEIYTRIPVRFITAETEARVAAKKRQDEDQKNKKRHDDKSQSKKLHDDQEDGKSFDDEKQHSRHRRHKEGHGKMQKQSAKAGDGEESSSGYAK